MKYSDMFSLKSEIIFVAGGAGLIGSEIVKACVEMGAKVVLLDINVDKSRNLENAQVFFEHFDLSKLEEIEPKIEGLIAKYGVPTGWVNASYPRTEDWSSCTFNNSKLSSLNENIKIHLNSSMWSANFIAKKMKEARLKGSLVNFGSIYGVVGQDMSIYNDTNMELNMIYSSIKGGLATYSKQMASYYGQFGIRVNCLCPGGIFDHQDKTFVQNYCKKVPLRRMGTPEDIASASVFLLSAASSYITGTTFMVDGGWTAI
ncbi:MAG: SDR family oxidoreductase [Bacteriovoracaceae bacterium]